MVRTAPFPVGLDMQRIRALFWRVIRSVGIKGPGYFLIIQFEEFGHESLATKWSSFIFCSRLMWREVLGLYSTQCI